MIIAALRTATVFAGLQGGFKGKEGLVFLLGPFPLTRVTGLARRSKVGKPVAPAAFYGFTMVGGYRTVVQGNAAQVAPPSIIFALHFPFAAAGPTRQAQFLAAPIHDGVAHKESISRGILDLSYSYAVSILLWVSQTVLQIVNLMFGLQFRFMSLSVSLVRQLVVGLLVSSPVERTAFFDIRIVSLLFSRSFLLATFCICGSHAIAASLISAILARRAQAKSCQRLSTHALNAYFQPLLSKVFPLSPSLLPGLILRIPQASSAPLFSFIGASAEFALIQSPILAVAKAMKLIYGQNPLASIAGFFRRCGSVIVSQGFDLPNRLKVVVRRGRDLIIIPAPFAIIPPKGRW